MTLIYLSHGPGPDSHLGPPVKKPAIRRMRVSNYVNRDPKCQLAPELIKPNPVEGLRCLFVLNRKVYLNCAISVRIAQIVQF